MTTNKSCPQRLLLHGLLGLLVLGGAASLRAAPVKITNVRAESCTTKGAIIRWNTDVPADGRVSFGRSLGNERQASETGPATDHYVFLGDLSPGARYSFRVQSAGVESAEQSFSTAARIEDLWPVISLSFDDGSESHHKNAFPRMRARNMRGMVNVITDRLANGVGLSLEQVRFLAAQGWEVGSHSRAHNRDKSLTSEQEVRGSLSYLQEQGFAPVSSYRIPGSNHGADRETLAVQCYPLRWGNVIGGPPSPRFTTLPLKPGIYAGIPLDARQLPTREERVAKYKAAIDRVLSERAYTHFIFHVIGDIEPSGYNYSPAEFEALLDYLVLKGIKVIPPGELLQANP